MSPPRRERELELDQTHDWRLVPPPVNLECANCRTPAHASDYVSAPEYIADAAKEPCPNRKKYIFKIKNKKRT